MKPEDHIKDGSPMAVQESASVSVPGDDFLGDQRFCGSSTGVSLHKNTTDDVRTIPPLKEDAKNAAMYGRVWKSVQSGDPDCYVPPGLSWRRILTAATVALSAFALVAFLLVLSCVPSSMPKTEERSTSEARSQSTKGHTIFVLKNGTVVIDPANQK